MKKYKFDLYAKCVKEYIIEAENTDDAEAMAIVDFKENIYSGIILDDCYGRDFEEV